MTSGNTDLRLRYLNTNITNDLFRNNKDIPQPRRTGQDVGHRLFDNKKLSIMQTGKGKQIQTTEKLVS